MNRNLATLGLVLVVASPASSQSLLDALLPRSAKPSAPAPGQPTPSSAAMSPEQQSALDRLILLPLPDKRIVADRQEAAPLIRAVVTTGACATRPSAWNAVNRYSMEPHTYDAYDIPRVPMYMLQHHDRRFCLDVMRLGDWSKPALNALRFTAYFIAADSGEAKRQTFELQKTVDGQWLIRDIGIMLD